MFKKEWLQGTELYPKKGEIGRRYTVDYSVLELHLEPTLLKKGISKNLEFLWCLSATVDPICSSKDHMLVKIEKDGDEEIAHIFEPRVIQFLNDYLEKEEYQLVIKTRIPLTDPRTFFNEIRHIEQIRKPDKTE